MTSTSTQPQQLTAVDGAARTRHLRAAKISAADAQTAALQLAPHLESPSACEYLAPRPDHRAEASLLQPSIQRPIRSAPVALFATLPLSETELPPEWEPAHRQWRERVRRTRALEMLGRCRNDAPPVRPGAGDGILAGLLLYFWSANCPSSLRQQWLAVALTDPVGAWLAAEGLHRLDERAEIVAAVRRDSQRLWWTAQIPGLGSTALAHAKAHLNLYGGLVLASHGQPEDIERWLHPLGVAGCEHAAAACAALVLQPTTLSSQQAGWLAALQRTGAERYAYETVRWARYTWPAAEWEQLKTQLRPCAVADRGQWFFHWFRDMEPDQAAAALGDLGVDPLWGAELLAELGDRAADHAFRFRLGERLGTLGDEIASLTLSWLNDRLPHR